ncbi:hypothetical protein ACIQVA_39355 [Streptomyces microflavus]|uniref:hypothetical protein n=1 Tax=Streptomyces microflavus TaxID=1919 RepID=UPI0038129346
MLFAGPQTCIHVLATSQLANGVLGEGCENFSTKVLGRVTASTWKHLAPEIHPAPEPNTHAGHVHVVQGRNAHPTEVLLLTDDEASKRSPPGRPKRTEPATTPHLTAPTHVLSRGASPEAQGGAARVAWEAAPLMNG